VVQQGAPNELGKWRVGNGGGCSHHPEVRGFQTPRYRNIQKPSDLPEEGPMKGDHERVKNWQVRGQVLEGKFCSSKI